MPNADWKKCAVCVALPTIQTRASQPETGNGSPRGVVLDQADQLLELVEVQVGEALLVVERLLEAHGALLGKSAARAPRCTPRTRCTSGTPLMTMVPASSSDRAGSLHNVPAIRRASRGRGRRRPLSRAPDDLDMALLTRAGGAPAGRGSWSSRGSPASPARRSPPRMQRLEEAGIVTGYGPDIDVEAAGFGVQAFVTLEIAQGALDAVRADLQAIPGVLEAHATTGSGDVLCRVAAASHEAPAAGAAGDQPVGGGGALDQRRRPVGAGALAHAAAAALGRRPRLRSVTEPALTAPSGACRCRTLLRPPGARRTDPGWAGTPRLGTPPLPPGRTGRSVPGTSRSARLRPRARMTPPSRGTRGPDARKVPAA